MKFSDIHFIKNRLFKAVEGHNKTERKVQIFPHYSLNPHKYSLHHYQHPPRQWYICYDCSIYTDTS